jgi:hypothetical protein
MGVTRKRGEGRGKEGGGKGEGRGREVRRGGQKDNLSGSTKQTIGFLYLLIIESFRWGVSNVSINFQTFHE